MNKTVKLMIKGKVQGVGYRRWFEKEAIQLHLTGYVKNLDNGDVEAVIAGDEQSILKMIHCSQVGPLRASVTAIEQLPADEAAYTDFKMIR